MDKIQIRIKNLLWNINNPDNVKVELIRRVENVKFTDIPIMNHLTSFGKSLITVPKQTVYKLKY